jgi:putative tricarboxylic transport membrane protein
MAEDVQSSRNTPDVGEPLTDRLKGGLIIAVIAFLLFMATFYISSPTVPRVMAILTAVVGVAVIAGLVPVRAPQDFYGGLALVLLGTFALIASAELPGQRGFAFGPGTAPRLFAVILAAIGVAVALIGVFSDGPRIEKYKIRGPALVIIGISLFAALIRPFGLVIATYLAFMISIMGSKEMRWVESVIAAAAMTLGCVLLFVYLLNLPFQLWPQANAPQLLFAQFADLFKSLFAIIAKLIPGLN